MVVTPGTGRGGCSPSWALNVAVVVWKLHNSYQHMLLKYHHTRSAGRAAPSFMNGCHKRVVQMCVRHIYHLLVFLLAHLDVYVGV